MPGIDAGTGKDAGTRRKIQKRRQAPLAFSFPASPRLRVPVSLFGASQPLKHFKLIALEAEFRLGLIDRNFIFSAPAGGAVVLPLMFHAGEHSVQ